MFLPTERKIEIRGREQKKNKLLKSSEESSAFVINQRLTFLWVTHRTLTVFRWSWSFTQSVSERKEVKLSVAKETFADALSLRLFCVRVVLVKNLSLTSIERNAQRW